MEARIRTLTDEALEGVLPVGATRLDPDDFWTAAQDFFRDTLIQEVAGNLSAMGSDLEGGTALKLFVRELTQALLLAAFDPEAFRPLHAELGRIAALLLSVDSTNRDAGLEAFLVGWTDRAATAQHEDEPGSLTEHMALAS